MQNKGKHGLHNSVQIQGGIWRGRRISFVSTAGVRPTKSIVKETLMNWLRPRLSGMDCLDLFSGSGSLAFELLSQGAKSVCCLDMSRANCEELKRNAGLLGAENLAVYPWSYPDPLPIDAKGEYDLILVDAPFGKNWEVEILQKIHTERLLKRNGLIYLELSTRTDWPEDSNMQIVKQKKSGGVQYGLYTQAE